MPRFNQIARSLVLSVALLLAAAVGVSANAASDNSDRPNVIVIMTDDQGIGDFGVNGNPVIETPHIDRLAEQSASAERFYVHPVCSPTRASLMTGRYNYRTGVVDTWLGRSMMKPDEVTVAEVLRDAGYATGIFGKWHLGDTYPMRPHDQGFEMAFVHRGGGLAQPSEPPENNERYTNPVLFRNGMKVETEGYCTDVYFDAALDWIERADRQNRPFFAYIPTNAPHGPYHDVPEDLYKKYTKKDLSKVVLGNASENRLDKTARIFAMIENVDHNVGRLVKKLDAMGLAEDTMLVFLNDNGPNGRRYVGELRGRKGQVYEGGIRSPLWVRWPGRLKPETTVEKITAHIDLMPTILDAAGVEPPEDLKLDGRSILPLLKGEAVAWQERALFIQSHRGDEPTRYAHFAAVTQDWKLLNASGFGRQGLRNNGPRFELYRLSEDPGEKNNLADEYPEVVQRLKKRYDAWFEDVSNTRPNNYAPPRIHVGTPHENPVVLTRQDWRYDRDGRGWAPDAIGYWLLNVAEPGRYDIRLRFKPAENPGKATLKIGDHSRTLPIAANAEARTFVDVPLQRGDARLDAVLTHEQDNGETRQRGVWQVDVLRR